MKYFEMFRGKIDKEGEGRGPAAGGLWLNAYHDSHDMMGPAHARDFDLDHRDRNLRREIAATMH